ncbi:MAG: dihydroxyacetone kinase subunit L [Kiloniellales bacterium]|nr:dihydroxyacetone kinase subunit L [Kiloniellales bacterium]
MASDLTPRLIDAAAAVIEAHAEELTSLDQAIGDGDHGINMKRGFQAVAETREALAPLALSEALQKAGMTLVMKVGGASGPLYGSLLMAMGKAGDGDPADAKAVAAMLAAGVEAVKKRGKSDAGEKTMLDVLAPVSRQLTEAAENGMAPADLLAALAAAAEQGLESTREMQATKGRASFLGERSVGHLDPGARSSQLLISAVCGLLRESVEQEAQSA